MDSNNWTAFFSLNVEDTQISSCIENQEPQIRYNNTSTISSGISSASDVQIFSPPFSAPIAKSTDSGMLISLDDGASIHSSDSFYEDEAKLIELIEETFADCNSLPFHCLLPCIRKVVGSNPQVFEVFPSVKGTLQVRCITKKVKFLNPDNAMSVRSVREEDIEWMKDTRSVLTDLPDHIKSVNASIMHVISPTLLLCSVSGPERVRILHNLMSKHEDKLIKPNSLTPGRLYIMKINNLLGRFVLLSQADQPGLFYSAAVDSNYIIKHDIENMYNCLWYFHTAVHPGRLFLARLRGNVKLNADDMHIISQYNVMYPDGYVPYQPVAIFSVSERVYLVDWIHNTTWISDQLKDSIVVEKDPALENAEGIFNQKWNPDSLPDTPEGILSNMYSTLPLYHSSINLPDGWFVNCLSFIEQLFVNDEADIIPNIMCLAKRLMMSTITLENLDMNLFPIGISTEMVKSGLEDLKLVHCRDDLRRQKVQGSLPPGYLLMGKNSKQKTQIRRTCEYLYEIFFVRGFQNFPALVQPDFEEKWGLYRAKLRESKEIKDWLPDEQKRDHNEEQRLPPVKFVKEGLAPRPFASPGHGSQMKLNECERGRYWDNYWRWSGYWKWEDGFPQQALPLQKHESVVCNKLQSLYVDKESLGSESLMRKLKRKATFDAVMKENDEYWETWPKGPPPKRVIVENINLEESGGGGQRTAERRGYHEYHYTYPPRYMEPPPPTGPFRALNILPPDYLKPVKYEDEAKRVNSYYIYTHDEKSYFLLDMPPKSRRVLGKGKDDYFEDRIDFFTRIGLSDERKSEFYVDREFKRLEIRKILEDKKLKEMGFVPKPKPVPRIKYEPRKPRHKPFSD